MKTDTDAAGQITIELEPIDPGELKGPGEDQAEVLTFRNKKNRVLLGKPWVTDYIAELGTKGDQVPQDLATLTAAGYSVLRVRPAISLLPDRGCIFTEIEFNIELAGKDASGIPTSEPPLAYAVRPSKIIDKLPFTHNEKTIQEIGGKAGVAAGKLIAKVTTENSFQEKGNYYLHRVYGYGTNFSQVGWRLQATRASDLVGDVEGLEVIVQVPRGSTLFGQFSIAAHIAIETTPDRWLTRAFGPRRAKPSLEVIYQLSV
jgi:hypothetical protein